MNIYISNIKYVLGTQECITTLCPDSRVDEVDILLNYGLDKYCKFTEGNEELAHQCVSATLDDSKLQKEEVEALIFSTTLQTLNSCKLDIRKLDFIQHSLGLKNAYTYGFFLSNCANLIGAIQLARSLLISEIYSELLIVVSDRIEHSADRFMESNESILSDGAVSFLISKKRGDYELGSLFLQNDTSYLTEETNIISYLNRASKNIKEIYAKIRNDDKYCHYKKVFLGNYNLMVQNVYQSVLNVDDNQMFFDNIARIGHVFSADLLINLLDYEEKCGLIKGDMVAFLGIGFNRYGGFSLKKL